MRKLFSGPEQTFLSKTSHQSLLETLHAEPLCEEDQQWREKETKKHIYVHFPWQSLHSMLEVTVIGVRLRELDSWQPVWTLQNFFALFTPSILLFYPWMSISLSALISLVQQFSSVSQVWTGHPACMSHHPYAEQNCSLSPLSVLFKQGNEWRSVLWNILIHRSIEVEIYN